MAKFRNNHNRERNPFIGLWVRFLIMIAILVVLFCLFYEMSGKMSSWWEKEEKVILEPIVRDYLPSMDSDNLITHHTYYSLLYSEKHELAKWVAYVLTKEDLLVTNVKRYKEYLVDPMIKSRSAHYSDYQGSGYTRGHLAPAGDMAFSNKAMKESFYMSNMAPQLRGFNNGIWKELEENVRDWAFDNNSLYITTGPLLNNVKEYIGDNDVAVPQSFYKALLDPTGRQKKSIAFIIPNRVSERPLSDYALSVDELEEKLGMDLFSEVLEENQDKIEASFNIKSWPMDSKRFDQRIKKWNQN